MQGTALQACLGDWGLLGLGREGRSREKQVNRPLNPFLSLPLSAHLFFFLFFPPPLLLLLFSDHAWWQTALIHLPDATVCANPCCLFTRAPSGACRIVVWQVRSVKAKIYFYLFFYVYIMSLCQQEEEDETLWNNQKSSQNTQWLATYIEKYIKMTPSPPPEMNRN